LTIGNKREEIGTDAQFADLTLIPSLHSFDIQASSLKEHCSPNPATGKTCDIYIAILSYTEASFSLTVSMRDGFKSRVTLITGQPQTGPWRPDCL
jgi:hypothetical protein